MYEFADKLMNIALPRVRDFRGVSTKAFDGRGNYALGIREQLLFPEIEYDKVDKIRGMEMIFVTTAKTDEEAKGTAQTAGYALCAGLMKEESLNMAKTIYCHPPAEGAEVLHACLHALPYLRPPALCAAESTASAAFASASLRTRAKSPACARRAGKPE